MRVRLIVKVMQGLFSFDACGAHQAHDYMFNFEKTHSLRVTEGEKNQDFSSDGCRDINKLHILFPKPDIPFNSDLRTTQHSS